MRPEAARPQAGEAVPPRSAPSRPPIEGGRTHFGKIRAPGLLAEPSAAQPARPRVRPQKTKSGAALVVAALAVIVLIGLYALAGGAGV